MCGADRGLLGLLYFVLGLIEVKIALCQRTDHLKIRQTKVFSAHRKVKNKETKKKPRIK